MSEWDEYEHEYNHSQEWSEASLRKMIKDVYWEMYYETYWEDIAPLKDQLKRLGYSPNDESNLYSFRPQVNNGYFYKSIDDLNTNQKIKMLQIALQYTLPRLQATMIKEELKDEPLFVEILERKPDSDEEVWADNFHVTERIKY